MCSGSALTSSVYATELQVMSSGLSLIPAVVYKAEAIQGAKMLNDVNADLQCWFEADVERLQH